VGLGFEFTFRRAVPAGSTMRMAWEVMRIEKQPLLGGDVLYLEGWMHDVAGGQLMVKATARLLMLADQAPGL
jgi:hypothetical protein